MSENMIVLSCILCSVLAVSPANATQRGENIEDQPVAIGAIVIQKKKFMFGIYFSLLALYHIERSDTCECETSQAIA
jgi:hypothetical protein